MDIRTLRIRFIADTSALDRATAGVKSNLAALSRTLAGSATVNFTGDASGLRGATATVQKSISNLKAAYGGVSNTKLNVDASGAERGLRSATREAGLLHRALGGVASGAGMLAGAVGFGALAAGAYGLGSSVIGMNSRLEQSQVAFTTLLGSGEAADAFLKDMAKFAATTPFEFPELIDASKRLMAMGFSAQEVRPVMTAVGDTVAALGGGSEMVGRVTDALGKMRTNGRLATEEMNMLTDAGIPAWKLLADSMGISTEELRKLAEQGAIPANVAIEKLTDAMGKNYGGAMAAQSKTFAGAMSTIKDSVSMALSTAFLPFFQELSNGAAKIAEFTQTEQFAGFTAGVATSMSGAFSAIGSFLAWLIPIFTSAFSALAPIVMPIITGITTGITSAFAMLWPYIQPAIENIKAGFVALQPAIAPLVAFLSGVLMGAFKALAPIIGIVLIVAINALALAFRGIAIVIGWVGQQLTPFIPQINFIGQVIGFVFATLITGAILKVVTMILRFLPVLGRLAPAFQFMLDVASVIFNALGVVFSAILSIAVFNFNTTRDVIVAVWGVISSVTQAIWNFISPFLESVFAAIGAAVSFWTNAWRITLETIWNIISTVTQFVWDAISSYLSNTWTSIQTTISVVANAISWLINDSWDWIYGITTNTWNTITRTISDTITSAKDTVMWVLNALGNEMSSVWNWIVDGSRAAWDSVANAIRGPLEWGVNTARHYLAELAGAVAWVLDKLGQGGLAGGLWEIKGGLERPVFFARGGIAQAARGGLADGLMPRAVYGEAGSPEAYIVKNRPTNEQLPYLQTAASWHGFNVVRKKEPAVGSHTQGAMRQRLSRAPSFMAEGGILAGMSDVWDGLVPHVAQIANKVANLFGVWDIGGYRPEDAYGEHSTGRAMDVMTYDNFDLGGTIADWILQYAGELGLNWIIYRQAINSGSGWEPMEDRGSPTQNHMDHIHAFFAEAGGEAGGAWGGIGRFVNWVAKAMGWLTERLPAAPDIGLGILGEGFTSFASSTLVDTAKDFVKGIASKMGFGGGDKAQVAKWMASTASAAGIPGELPVMTALVESELQNLDYGDRDSLGYFQQRPSQGWGTAEQIMDPNYSLGKFLEVASGYIGQYSHDAYGLGAWAQAVQRSAFPERYAERYDEARSLIGYALGGVVPGTTGESRLLMAHAGERVLPSDTNRAFEHLAASIANWARGSNQTSAPTTLNLTVNVDGEAGDAQQLALKIRDEVEKMLIKLQRDGAAVSSSMAQGFA